MKWTKKGLVFGPDGKRDWQKSHAIAPAPLFLDERTIRVFVGFFDKEGISRLGWVDLEAAAPARVRRVSEKPLLELGRPGAFDDNGMIPAGVLRANGKIYLYYTGFQTGVKVRYYMFGGLALSEDGGRTFRRVQETPVLERSSEGLYFRGGPCALHEKGIFKLWYSAGNEWEKVGGKERPTYDIYYQESTDGIHCGPEGTPCVSYDRASEHGLGRPQIFKRDSTYRLFYTVRTKDMRYSMGFAESSDGAHWTKKDREIGLKHSPSGWDSQMVYFPSVLQAGDKTYLFYNGNNFGEKGFGLAELEKW